MAGRGRPASDNPRSVKVDIRLTSDEKARLDAYAERYGLTKTQVLMKAFDELEAKKSKRKQLFLTAERGEKMAKSRKDARGYALHKGECQRKTYALLGTS